eukprot:scaffold7328_cov314-Pinguiococcus_pyrenoidosus.AAC.97
MLPRPVLALASSTQMHACFPTQKQATVTGRTMEETCRAWSRCSCPPHNLSPGWDGGVTGWSRFRQQLEKKGAGCHASPRHVLCSARMSSGKKQ